MRFFVAYYAALCWFVLYYVAYVFMTISLVFAFVLVNSVGWIVILVVFCLLLGVLHLVVGCCSDGLL